MFDQAAAQLLSVTEYQHCADRSVNKDEQNAVPDHRQQDEHVLDCAGQSSVSAEQQLC